MDLSESIPAPLPPNVPLPPDDDRFCALYSMGVAVTKAYADAYNCGNATHRDLFALAQRTLCRPEIAARLEQLNNQFVRCLGITKAGHLAMLAEIRDRALELDDVGIALQSEKSRGQVAGYYAEVSASRSRSIIDVTEGQMPDVTKLSDDEVSAMAELVEKMRGGAARITYEEQSASIKRIPRDVDEG